MSMIIKKLELQGFKSFAERTKLVFHPGITAIVGPNGTGKSNLVDAVLWILGGHRHKTVRGDRTEDVIFNGNAKKPALSMADAVLTLSDGQEELVLSHRVFRSGEGEYRLNGKAVRLKDILDELWKHGIGEREYFVIEQGAIGTFVTSKPADKRLFIEEAAGTAFYKDKKRQAQSKLESTEQNLTRLEDIIAEVERAKNSLQRQAQAANRFHRLRERIRDLTTHHYRRKILQLDAARRTAEAEYEAALARERDLADRVRRQEKELASRREEIWSLERGLKENQERLFALRARIAAAESEAERESKRIEFFEEKKAKAEADRDELLVDLLALTKEIEESRVRLTEIEAELGSSSAETVRIEELFASTRDSSGREEEEIKRLRDDHLAALQALTEARNEAVKAAKEAELLGRQEDKLRAQAEELAAALEESRARAAALERDIESQRALREAGVGRAEDAKNLLAGLESEAASLRDRLENIKSRRDGVVVHLQALRKVDERSRREAESDEVPGGLGLLADLIRSAREDAPLFDAFWREEARSPVVPVEALLGGLPEGLRGTYLLVPAKARPAVAEDLLSRPGVLGLLKSRAEVDGKLRDRLHGLPDAVIVADASLAVRLWAERPDLSFLTPAGDLLLSSGLLKLGRKEEGAIALAAEIRRLEAEAASLEAEGAPLSAELDEVSRRADATRKDLELVREELERTERIIQDKEREHRYALAEAEKVQASRSILEREIEILQAERGELAERVRQAEETLLLRETEARSLRERIAERERAVAARAADTIELERRVLAARAGLDLLREKRSGLADRLRATERRREAAEAKTRQLEAEARRSQDEQARLREQVASLRGQARELSAERDIAELALTEAESRIEALRAALLELESGLRRGREEEEAAAKERVRHEIRKAEIERDLVNLDEVCWQELKKTVAELRLEAALSEAPPAAGAEVVEEEAGEEEEEEEAGDAAPAPGEATEAPPPRRPRKAWRPIAEMTDEEVERELEEARETLNRYKNINMMAGEEYLEKKKRYEFLVAERQDLRDSIASTEEAIRKIDEESKAQFLKALEEVNKSFQEIFASLFKGGNAEVKLLEPDNPLESGVEIVAQPPGKRVQNLSLLSGGEKSLTSLAFLFALFRYRPSPFCFLDEVDAALDDVNLARFLDLLKSIKGRTQFILVTHNYKTMEVADYIYGTTMPEPNITKLLSVKLEKKAVEETDHPTP